MTNEAPKTICVAEVEWRQSEADEIIGLFNHPGWRHMARIFANQQSATAQELLGRNASRTLQELGIAQGSYGICLELADLPRQFSEAYEDVFRESDK